jgi:uncharacterized protein HemX
VAKLRKSGWVILVLVVLIVGMLAYYAVSAQAKAEENAQRAREAAQKSALEAANAKIALLQSQSEAAFDLAARECFGIHEGRRDQQCIDAVQPRKLKQLQAKSGLPTEASQFSNQGGGISAPP